MNLVEKEIQDRKATVEVCSPLGTVFAHLPTFKQIMTNLISNSLKFMSPDRPPRVRIYTARSEEFIRLCIEDNGIGIAPEHHEKIFGMFQRLHDNQTYPGTGIGLALVRKGAERMGGRVGRGIRARPRQLFLGRSSHRSEPSQWKIESFTSRIMRTMCCW